MSYNLLSEPIRRYIRDQRWEELRPIQAAAIQRILTTDTDFILASRTASGKTEAAFLPILSRMDFAEPGVQVIYISPLKALINDQFYRIEDLCRHLDVTVTKWHGEANRSLKEKLINNPHGIVLITPESLEAMLANRPFNIPHLFSNLKFVVIDEIHSFIGSDRGLHLRSILSRVRKLLPNRFRIVGLSATVGDYDEAKKYSDNPAEAKILRDNAAREIEGDFRYFEAETNELPLLLLKDMYREVSESKVLIFPNARGRTEEIAVKLKKIADRVRGHTNYFSHHSSVHKDVREYVEFFAKSSRRENFAIACTSTLELGIDIGSVDKVVQVEATNSVSSLIQRVGRSGRKEGAKGKLLLYATDEWELLQSLACWSLYRDNMIEPPAKILKPYDILLHQALSIVKGEQSISVGSLIDRLVSIETFEAIERSEIEKIVGHMIFTDLIEKAQGEVFIGLAGEKIANSRDFYSVFETEPLLKVVSSGRPIGQIPLSPQIIVGEKILLAAKVWKIVDVDLDGSVIEVVRAPEGRAPRFDSGSGELGCMIPQRMIELLYSSEGFSELDEKSNEALATLRKKFSIYPVEEPNRDRPFVIKNSGTVSYVFRGSKVKSTLWLLLQIAGVEDIRWDSPVSFEAAMDSKDLTAFLSERNLSDDDVDAFLLEYLSEKPFRQEFSKYSRYLPLDLQVALIKERQYDLPETERFLSDCRWVGAANLPD